MVTMVNRDAKQDEIAKLWLDSDRLNSIIVGTGVGKSKIAMIIMEELFNEKALSKKSKILLLTNSEDLRDTNWQNDFIKWDYGWMWDLIVSECYQTAYKWKDTKWDLIIGDEIDFALSPEYSKSFLNNEAKMILGMTGFVDSSKMELLDQIAPMIINYSTQDAQNDGILNQTQLVMVEYDLSRNPQDLKVEYKKDGQDRWFTQSENDAYGYIENKCNVLYGMLQQMESDPGVVFSLDEAKMKQYRNIKYQYNRAILARKKLLYEGIASVQKTQYLMERILNNPINKILCFSMWTNQADKIHKHTYHEKNKKGNIALTDLSKGNIRSLGVCKAVNRGVNLEGVNNLIMESYDGSATQFTQRHGRGTRLHKDQTMYLYIMLPYYYKKVKDPENPQQETWVRRPTQMVKWAERMMQEFTFKKPLSIRI